MVGLLVRWNDFWVGIGIFGLGLFFVLLSVLYMLLLFLGELEVIVLLFSVLYILLFLFDDVV